MKGDNNSDEGDKKLTKEEWGMFVRNRRQSLGLSQISLAQKIGIAQGIVSLLERGKQKRVKKYNLDNFAEALQYTKEELLEKFPKNENDQPKTELGKIIQTGRKKSGLTRGQLAEKMQMSRYQVKYLEIGDNQKISYGLARKISIALELEPIMLARFIRTSQNPTGSALGKLIRESRTNLLMDAVSLSVILGVSKQRISQIELGQYCLISKESDEFVLKLAEALQLDVKKIQAVRLKRWSKKPNQAMKTRSPLGGFINTRRLKLDLTQSELGRRAGGMSYQFISELETGKAILSPRARQRIEKGLGCKIPIDLLTSN